MRQGEKAILLVMGVVIAGAMLRNWWSLGHEQKDRGIPFYSTASTALATQGADLYRQNHCRQCHSLWTMTNLMESIPAPALDGIGSLRDEQWFYQYLSASDPQRILPSRLKAEYRMPSYAMLPDEERQTLAKYLASLKVQDWYLPETRKAEYEKLTGKKYQQ